MVYVRTFAEIGMNDIAEVGGKNASLGEMYRSLTPKGVKIPFGFATTSAAYHYFLSANNLDKKIATALAELDVRDTRALTQTGARIRHWIRTAILPADLAEAIRNAYRALEQEYGPNPDVAARSSATAEDLPTASFAGQQETYLNIRGSQNLLETCRHVYASLFTDRAISYRAAQGFAHSVIALSIGVQKMVRADLGASGVMFSIDTETGFRDVAFITSTYGLGENIVQGKVNPDEFYVHKPMLEAGKRPILKRQLGTKAIKMIYTADPVAGQSTRDVPVRDAERARFSIDDEDVLQLARYAIEIERHYTARAGHPTPMDIEWAKDGESGELFIVQARPETVKSRSDAQFHEIYHLERRGPLVTQGKSVGQKIGAGNARVIMEAAQMHDLREGEVLVTDITDPDWEPVMRRAAAIVTNRGGRTCHAAIVAREFGIPAVVGCGDATQKIHDDMPLTVSCAEGDSGFVYAGILPFQSERIDLSKLAQPKTQIYLNIGNPEQAFDASFLPVTGVGLARLEFIINHSIGIHPRALLEPQALDAETRHNVEQRAAGYPGLTQFYVSRLAEGIGTIAAAFYPRPVIMRFSDFKSNEYAALLGGTAFEPVEENPMIGFRGASRYPSPQFAECFALECQAVKFARETMGLDNIAVMIPFVRTVQEAQDVIALMSKHQLRRGGNGLRVYMMCEIPANALLAKQFLEHFDGFSIGSNDLTQLTLGVDRDSGLIGGVDERNPAVLQLMDMAITECRRQKKYIGICGQAPSDFPEITHWLVERAVDSISLNADSVLRMTQVVLDTETELGR
ncbi:MAG: phosphoenolpyruvate synthase [Gammaproteobacteria bacterium]|nr:phosphoenolpyruvate synthase [Gammaproteobacteria bacterium]